MRSKETQIGGNHYSKRKIQPFDIIDEYGLDFYEANALKYILRHKEKNGKEDILKAKDYLDAVLDRHYPEEANCEQEELFERGNYFYISSTTDIYFGDVLEAHCFRSWLDDEQLKEATGRYSDVYVEADNLSVETRWTIEEIITAYKAVEFVCEQQATWFYRREVYKMLEECQEYTLEYVLFSLLLQYLPIENRDCYLFKDIKRDEVQSLTDDGFMCKDIGCGYTLVFKTNP